MCNFGYETHFCSLIIVKQGSKAIGGDTSHSVALLLEAFANQPTRLLRSVNHVSFSKTGFCFFVQAAAG